MSSASLEGLSILVVEDEYFLADELEQGLAKAGAHVLGPVSSVDGAEAVLGSADRPDYALLDANLNGESAFPLADRLSDMEIPFAFVTGYGASSIPARFAGRKRFDKPVEVEQLVEALAAV